MVEDRAGESYRVSIFGRLERKRKGKREIEFADEYMLMSGIFVLCNQHVCEGISALFLVRSSVLRSRSPNSLVSCFSSVVFLSSRGLS